MRATPPAAPSKEPVGLAEYLDDSFFMLGRTSGIGDLVMWLQFMWLQFEVVRRPVGSFGVDLGPVLGRVGPQVDPKRPRPDFGRPQLAAT